MAIYHLHAKIIGRSKGKSAVAAAAYRAAEILHSDREQMEFDFSRKGGVVFSNMLLPDHAPEWMKNREKLWNAVEQFETRKDANYAREIEVSLPVELSMEQQKELLHEFISDNFVKAGMIADYSIHKPDSKTPNPHSHIMLTMRPVVENSFGMKAREWNDKKLFVHWREQWAAVSNKHLALAGVDKKISHLSHADQGIDLEPSTHRGYMSRGNFEILDRYQKSKEIKERNFERLLTNPEIALDVLTHHESIFSHHDLARFVNERTTNVDEFNVLKMAIEVNASTVSLGTGLDGKEYFTSARVLKQEQDLIAQATKLSKSNLHQLNPKAFDYIFASRTLNAEQVEAFKHIMAGSNLSLVVGFAGTGKSYLMDAVREAYESCGYAVVGTALSGRAADGLKQSANIESHTIARFLMDWEKGRRQLTNKTVLVIDEIGMVGTRQFQALLAEAELVGAKVIGCGDPEQISPVEAGCPFRHLLERLPHISLKNVVRQKEEWQRQATVELSSQQHGKALDQYRDHDFVHAHETRIQAMSAVVDRWHAYTAANPAKSAVMMSYRNVDVLSMNLMARERLQKNQQLGKASPIKTAGFGLLEFAAGERVMFLRNENSLGVRNGMLGRVDRIDETTITIVLDKGEVLSFDTREYNDLGYGYASTVHKLQGETVDQSYVLASKCFDRFITNVSMNRHRDNVELHYGKDEFASYNNLKRTLSRGDSKVLAVEFAQARGIEYPVETDVAAQVESQKDFAKYHVEVLAEAVPIKDTLADTYLTNQGLTDINVSTVLYHPAVWERETQSFMPALVAKAVGQGAQGMEVKGVQITFLSDKGEKAAMTYPVRYSGSSDAIIMLQKPAKIDHHWIVSADLETGLALTKVNPGLRVACLATQERFDKNPLQSYGKNELVFCASQTTSHKVTQEAVNVFSRTGFSVLVAYIEQEKKFENLIKVKQEPKLNDKYPVTNYMAVELEQEIELI